MQALGWQWSKSNKKIKFPWGKFDFCPIQSEETNDKKACQIKGKLMSEHTDNTFTEKCEKNWTIDKKWSVVSCYNKPFLCYIKAASNPAFVSLFSPKFCHPFKKILKPLCYVCMIFFVPTLIPTKSFISLKTDQFLFRWKQYGLYSNLWRFRSISQLVKSGIIFVNNKNIDRILAVNIIKAKQFACTTTMHFSIQIFNEKFFLLRNFAVVVFIFHLQNSFM